MTIPSEFLAQPMRAKIFPLIFAVLNSLPSKLEEKATAEPTPV
jgi:hypothetical protein